jgi:N-acyl-D-aspartate/D-glutamate deacylase
MSDLVIKGGTVVDGTGAPGRRADVAITGDRITAIGDRLDGDRELDASGCVVAPGFIDIHTHYDAQVFWDPALTPSCFHGVTTVVAGNCGFSIAPTRPEHHTVIARTLENVEDMNVASLAAGIPWDFETHPEYLESIRRRGTYLNFGAYIGHTALRLFAMGDDAYERQATPEEVERMREIVRQAMDGGAMGLATTFAVTHRGIDGKPVPSRHADLSEFEALAGVLGELGKGVVQVTPGKQLGIADMYAFQQRIGRPITYTALLTMPNGMWRDHAELNESERAKGVQVWPQVSPRPLMFSMSVADPFTLNPAPMFAELMAGSRDERLAAYGDPDWRRRAVDDLQAAMALPPRWATFAVMETPSHPEIVGRPLTEVAEEWGCHPLDVLLQVAVDDKLETRVRATLANDDPEGVAYLLQQESCTLGLSDAGAHVGQLCDAPQATDLLGNWVRDKGVLSLEAAVRKLSGQQADIFGLADRGYVREGAAADLAVFDPATVAPGPLRRVRDFPADADRLTADEPAGVRHVLVNGTPIQVDGRPVWPDLESRPGRVVSPS